MEPQEHLNLAGRAIATVDLLQATIDDLVTEYEALQDEYLHLQEENDRLNDMIEEMAYKMQQKQEPPNE